MSLSKEQILSSKDITIEKVHVPDWGGDVNVIALMGHERDDFEQKITAMNGEDATVNLANIRAKLVALTAVDDDGKRIFTPADVQELGKKSARALDLVFDVARELAGLKPDEVKKLAKNSEPGQQDSTTSS